MKSSEIESSSENKNGNFNPTFTKQVNLTVSVRGVNSSQEGETDTRGDR